MNRKPQKGLLKHADFIIIDIICLQLSFVLAYWTSRGLDNPYDNHSFAFLAVVLIISQLLTVVFTNNYNGILRRGRLKELISVMSYTFSMLIISLIFLFAVHESTTVSRLQLGITLAIYVVIDYLARRLNGKRLRSGYVRNGERKGRSLVLITTGALVDEAISKLLSTENGLYQGYFISGIVLMDGDRASITEEYDIPVVDLDDRAIARLKSKWVDEVFILQPSYRLVDIELFNTLTEIREAKMIRAFLMHPSDSFPSVLGAFRFGCISIWVHTFQLFAFAGCMARSAVQLLRTTVP